MGKQEKSTYLTKINERYHRSSKKIRVKILDEFCEVCGYNRKYAIRLLNKSPAIQVKKSGPKTKYESATILEPLSRIWIGSGKPCSKKLKQIIPEWLGHYSEFFGPIDAFARNQLITISAATIDRMLATSSFKEQRKGLSGTKPGALLKSQILIHDNHWDLTQPGYFEADTVALCGDSLVGGFIWCVTMTDIATQWTEARGAWNKGASSVLNKIKDVENILPFPMLGFDCDNGTEFLNQHLIEYLTNRKKPVKFTRSRPYRKNDNAHVEQKNWTHVRKLFGYERFGDPRLVPMVNDLLANEWSRYKNHFIPAMKLVTKVRVGSKYKKVYDKPQTPYHRLLQLPVLDKMTKLRLVEYHKQLNPFRLKQVIDKKLEEIMRLARKVT